VWLPRKDSSDVLSGIVKGPDEGKGHRGVGYIREVQGKAVGLTFALSGGEGEEGGIRALSGKTVEYWEVCGVVLLRDGRGGRLSTRFFSWVYQLCPRDVKERKQQQRIRRKKRG